MFNYVPAYQMQAWDWTGFIASFIAVNCCRWELSCYETCSRSKFSVLKRHNNSNDCQRFPVCFWWRKVNINVSQHIFHCFEATVGTLNGLNLNMFYVYAASRTRGTATYEYVLRAEVYAAGPAKHFVMFQAALALVSWKNRCVRCEHFCKVQNSN